ncbi:DUF2303 family protein [Vibrio metschnikovii]|uniref:DUF2303 family protein n=1 Tax=Vibrio metschnikovii TaxID=28172 RepID=UPI001302338F|nr:DUF2303 family protein [Vibrio metschnikovii]
MLNKEAIEHIQHIGHAPAFLDALDKHCTFPSIALPESYKLVDLEHMMPNRNQFRGTLHTANLDEFVRYHENYQLEGNQCFVDAEKMRAQTIFDLGTQSTPGHCKHRANLQLKKTSLFSNLLSINERQQGQKKLAEWIEDYSDFIQVFTAAGEKIENAIASSAVRNMTFEAKQGRETSVDDFSHHQSEYESMAVRSKGELPMPAVFKFTCVPYLGLEERTFEMRMSAIGNEVLVLRIKKLEQHEEEMAEEFKDKLIGEFAKSEYELDTFIGTFES